MTSLGPKTSERLYLCHLSCRLRAFAQELVRLALTPRDAFDGHHRPQCLGYCFR